MTPAEEVPLAELVGRIAAGDAQAEGELVARCGRTLRFLCRRFTRDEAAAEDLYQETLLLALEKIRHNKVREPEHLGAFLRSLAKNLSVKNYRRRFHQAEAPITAADNAADERAPDPLGGLLDRERVQRTRHLLAEMATPRDRTVLFRYYIGEESSAQICDDLAISGDHFYRVLHRARQRYRRLWEAQAAAG